MESTGIHPDSYETAKRLIALLYERARHQKKVEKEVETDFLISEVLRNSSSIREMILETIQLVKTDSGSERGNLAAVLKITEIDLLDLLDELEHG